MFSFISLGPSNKCQTRCKILSWKKSIHDLKFRAWCRLILHLSCHPPFSFVFSCFKNILSGKFLSVYKWRDKNNKIPHWTHLVSTIIKSQPTVFHLFSPSWTCIFSFVDGRSSYLYLGGALGFYSWRCFLIWLYMPDCLVLGFSNTRFHQNHYDCAHGATEPEIQEIWASCGARDNIWGSQHIRHSHLYLCYLPSPLKISIFVFQSRSEMPWDFTWKSSEVLLYSENSSFPPGESKKIWEAWNSCIHSVTRQF